MRARVRLLCKSFTDRVKTLFYSGDWRRVTRGGAFCAFWPGKPPVVTQAASMSAVPARFGPHMAALSRPESRHQGLDAEDVERSPQIVDERRQAELGPDVVESLHQKCALVHPLLDRAEGMFDGLAAGRGFPASPSGGRPCGRAPPRSPDARPYDSRWCSAAGSDNPSMPPGWRSRSSSNPGACFHSATKEPARPDK